MYFGILGIYGAEGNCTVIVGKCKGQFRCRLSVRRTFSYAEAWVNIRSYKSFLKYFKSFRGYLSASQFFIQHLSGYRKILACSGIDVPDK